MVATNTDPRRLNPAQQRLVEEYHRQWNPVGVLCRVWPREYKTLVEARAGDDEIESLCWLAVVYAARKFDPARRNSFATYVTHWLRGCAAEHIRGIHRRTLLPVTVNGDENELWASLHIPAPDPTAERERLDDQRVRVRAGLAGIDRRLRRVLVLRYGLDGLGSRTLQEVGDILGMSKERVRQLQDQAVSRCKDPELAAAFGR